MMDKKRLLLVFTACRLAAEAKLAGSEEGLVELALQFGRTWAVTEAEAKDVLGRTLTEIAES